jgi:hypothetical protein
MRSRRIRRGRNVVDDIRKGEFGDFGPLDGPEGKVGFHPTRPFPPPSNHGIGTVTDVMLNRFGTMMKTSVVVGYLYMSSTTKNLSNEDELKVIGENNIAAVEVVDGSVDFEMVWDTTLVGVGDVLYWRFGDHWIIETDGRYSRNVGLMVNPRVIAGNGSVLVYYYGKDISLLNAFQRWARGWGRPKAAEMERAELNI